jgi:hypothetical protein
MGDSTSNKASIYGKLALAFLVGWTFFQLAVFAIGMATSNRDSDFYIDMNLAIGWMSFPIYAAGIIFFILWLVQRNRWKN